MPEIKLVEENYYSNEMNEKYASVSQFKSFFGNNGCEEKAMAELKGKYVRPKSIALLLGSYVDACITDPDTVDKFIEEHPEMISSRGATKGLLKAEFQRGNQMVERVKNDKKMMAYLSGDHQTIMTGTLFGLDWKIKMDSYLPGKAIVDLKTVESLHKGYWVNGRKMSFIEAFDYILQGAIYQEIVFQKTGERLPFYLACVSKEDVTDIELIHIDDETLHERIYGNEFQPGIADQCNQLRLLKSGEVKPCGCGRCEWCISHKKITKPISWLELQGGLD